MFSKNADDFWTNTEEFFEFAFLVLNDAVFLQEKQHRSAKAAIF